jgi:hypothetical protein
MKRARNRDPKSEYGEGSSCSGSRRGSTGEAEGGAGLTREGQRVATVLRRLHEDS